MKFLHYKNHYVISISRIEIETELDTEMEIQLFWCIKTWRHCLVWCAVVVWWLLTSLKHTPAAYSLSITMSPLWASLLCTSLS